MCGLMIKMLNDHVLKIVLNPIPAGGGVNLTPPCSFFYITQKVLV